MSIYIVYKTTNLVTNQYYIGYHKQKPNFDQDTFDGYFGSGLILKRAIQKYGEKNFHRETLFSTSSKEECMLKESELISNIINDELSYNILNGAFGGDNQTKHPQKEQIVEKRKKAWTKELREHIANSRRNQGDTSSYESRLRTRIGSRNNMLKNNPMKNPEIAKRVGEMHKGKFTGDKNPAKRKEVREMISLKLKGRKIYNNGVANKRFFPGTEPAGWVLGKI